ncbi:MAG: hypothetical protein A2817_00290 [Candidatus Yanofskybacteria bacterium RIFCSPHIGHO2_01_FULL_39_8b]|uniref:HEPN domain-containing protein n=1 Tax=Candidatus Yanofskybacteria bacterium RIFCSPHIGHO2_01_FULL_39_8b TaxID=1802659 RepID=A0A1F8EE16_9BACT|nr:MAG: hypothetical protein A2817_00290 [Candidatus Yanofskybacteria bacterium RIFCSPHIGHO2_01_FULL_39_8b]
MKSKTLSWIKIADDDFAVAKDNFKDKHYAHAVYMCHQTIEKYLKALVQELTDQIPPYTHNFNILMEASGVFFSQEIENKILLLAPHYIPTRYPEELEKLKEQYTEEATQNYIKNALEIITWLKNKYLE